MIRRAAKKNYIAIVIDPIYKIITGDENSADQMAHFTNQFDKVCTELGSAVIYCHHHSKGSQGNKRSMDRASGSGVFARDPDALLDLVQLELTDNLIKQQQSQALCQYYIDEIKKRSMEYFENNISDDDMFSTRALFDHLSIAFGKDVAREIDSKTREVQEKVKQRTAWRIEGTLREFARFEPVNVWFDHPIHRIDDVGTLSDIDPEGSQPLWQKATDKRKKNAEKKKKNAKEDFTNAWQYLNDFKGDAPTKKELADYLSISERTVQKRINDFGFKIDNSDLNRYRVIKKDSE